MKTLAIIVKDLSQGFRSAFALVFMFVLPLLITGMFYLMFGGVNSGGFNLPRTQVVVANLDQGHDQTGALGQTLVDTFRGPEFAGLVEVSTAESAEAARLAVDEGEAGVAVIIPAGFSAAFAQPEAVAEIELYQDPELTTGPEVVKTILNQLTEAYAGVKIAALTAHEQNLGHEQIDGVVTAYLEGSPSTPDSLIESRSLAAAPGGNMLKDMVGMIMAGMMIFFAFFTGVNTASTLLKEEEAGTLPRLFTTPTRQREVIAGKFLSVGLIVAVQIVILLTAARLIFGIEWGALPLVALAALGIICASAAFGIFLCSLLKNTRQAGVVSGGVLTVTGMTGMMDVFTGGLSGGQFSIVPLFTPQGWAARSLLLSMQGTPFVEVLPYVLVLLAASLVLFFAGSLRFQKRYA